ncbi:PP2C family protein-serine/threonine phosphatase [Microbacterium halophytorum]|uniref:PP2C family protein-serine/threonine phosphatase n=1 Tax=Microbacterium halophytorum TaxID=2067568 RepID=UPI000CFC70E6|nr:protein phosphatase 2C domain-containing protein [Microbacterium halophytorum]
MTAPITTVAGAATDVGARRRLNEDAFLASAPVFMVADGMGGHDAGEIASAAAVHIFSELVGRASVTVDDARDVFLRARETVDEISRDRENGAGTTFAGALITEVDGAGYWLAINLGDSRVYRMAAAGLEQVSVDHSVVQELVDSGRITPEQARRDNRRNVITRAMGAGSDADADYWMLPASVGDRLLLCTDGLSNELRPERIGEILRAVPDPEAAARTLVGEALERGGRDNITAVVVDALMVRGGARDEEDSDTKPREAVAR